MLHPVLHAAFANSGPFQLHCSWNQQAFAGVQHRSIVLQRICRQTQVFMSPHVFMLPEQQLGSQSSCSYTRRHSCSALQDGACVLSHKMTRTMRRVFLVLPRFPPITLCFGVFAVRFCLVLYRLHACVCVCVRRAQIASEKLERL